MIKLISLLFALFTFCLPTSFAVEIDGTGTTGTQGADGESYDQSTRRNNRGEVSSTGQCQTTPGRHGGDGDNGGAGGRGSDFDLQVSDNGQILIVGTETSYETGSAQQILVREQTRINGVVQIVARGGTGGRPGQGGDGEGAQEGQDSRDDSSSENQDGGDGCDAGLAGNGGDSGTPGDGGAGGNVTFRLTTDDAHLIFALAADIRGGETGERLSGGEAGRRAEGGQGGEGYYDDRSGQYPTGRMVDEPGCTSRPAREVGTGRYEDRNCRPVTRTVNGNETITNECDRVEITRTEPAVRCRQVEETAYRRVIVTTDDGDRGDSSPRARDGESSPNRARRGDNGSATIIVTDSATGEVREFSFNNNNPNEILNLSMLSYDLVEEDPNGIFEPGENVVVRNLRIRNRGAIAYDFNSADTIVSLRSSEWLVANPTAIELPRIEAGETITIEDPGLSFRIRSATFQSTSETPVWQDTIMPINRITRVEKSWDGLRLPRTFHIMFPVKISDFTVPTDINVGQTVNIEWTIENLSRVAIPEIGDYAREVRTQLGFQSNNIADDQVSIQIGDGDASDVSDNLAQMVSGLQPREVRTIHGTLSVHPSTEPYSLGRLNLGLMMNQLHQENLTPIQNLSSDIRVTRVYRTNPEDDVLLVLTQSNLDIYRSWMRLFGQLGIQGNIWDLSIDGGFSFFRSLEAGGTLSQNFANKTVVLPQIFQREGTVSRSLSQGHRNLYRASEDNKNNIYMIGYEAENFQALLSRSLVTTDTIEHESSEAFLEQLHNEFTISETEVHKINVSESYYFVRQPRMNTLLSTKASIENELKATLPNSNFMVSLVYEPVQTAANPLWSTYTIGHILVRKGLSQNNEVMMSLLPTRSNQSTHRFISGNDNILSLCLALNPSTKLKALKHVAQQERGSANVFRRLLNCVQHAVYQNWLTNPDDLSSTQLYIDGLIEVESLLSDVKETRYLQAIAMMSVMAEQGFSAQSQIKEMLDSSLISRLNATDRERVNGYKARVVERISRAASNAESSLETMTKTSILKSVNPRTLTSGIDADDIAQ